MPKVKRNHTSSRSLICLICRFKIFKNGRILTDKMKLTEMIRGQYNLLSHYDPSDTTFPNAICSTCCRGVYSSAGNEGGRLPLLRACAYTHTLSDPTTATHTRTCSNASACDICQTAGQRVNPSTRNPCLCPTCIKVNHLPTTTQNKSEKPQKTPLFTTTKLLHIQEQQNASNIKMIKLAKSLRDICGRSSVEPGFRENLIEISKKAEGFYSNTTLRLQISNKIGYEDRVLVFCNDVEALVMYVLNARGYDPYNHLVRIGLDGGGGMFKVVVNIVDTTGLHAKGSFKDTSVKRTLILAAVENIKETHENIQLILSQIKNFDRIKYYICSDLKLINIISGISSCSGKYPCSYCYAEKTQLFNGDGESRTTSAIQSSASAYRIAGSIKKNAMFYGNCINEPLLPGADNERILDICASPELHLMQSIVHRIYEAMYKEWPGVTNWLKQIHIKQTNYHHGTFVGNDCEKML